MPALSGDITQKVARLLETGEPGFRIGEEPMATNTRTAENASVRPQWLFCGTDETGTDHVYNTVTDSVVAVAPDGHREHVADLSEASIDEWMAFVAEKRGWNDRHLFKTFGDALAARVS
jgi:hypothetical protein